jgi:GT2 family glycosyltransferase
VTPEGVSIVVPTKNRAESVLRLLHALNAQDPGQGGFEVIVVADGCSDGTPARVRATRWNFDLHVLDLPPSGPALARNCGAALARGRILLFLDDDVEQAPGVVSAHAELHASGERQLGLGYLPPIPNATGFFGASLRGWWESMFDGPRRPGHRHSFRDLLSGHFSIHLADFESLRGFDTTFSCHEDWEFGYRALQAGLRFAFVAAAAWHYDATDVARALRRKFEEGSADVHLARIHPELIPVLPIGWTTARERRSRVIDLAWRHPRAGDRLFAALVRLLPAYEHWRLRFRWRALLERAMIYWYWRGVAHALGSRAALAALLSQQPPGLPPEDAVDVADGVGAAASRIDERRPRSVRVTFRGRHVGDIPAVPGSEPLRGIHLRAALAGELSLSFAQALAAEHQLPDPIGVRLRAQAEANRTTRARSPEAFAA